MDRLKEQNKNVRNIGCTITRVGCVRLLKICLAVADLQTIKPVLQNVTVGPLRVKVIAQFKRFWKWLSERIADYNRFEYGDDWDKLHLKDEERK